MKDLLFGFSKSVQWLSSLSSWFDISLQSTYSEKYQFGIS